MADLQSHLDKILGVADIRSITPSGREVYDPSSRSARRFKPDPSMASRSTHAGQGRSVDINVPLLSKRAAALVPKRRGMTAEVMLQSRFNEYGLYKRKDHIAEVFFRTDSADTRAAIEVLDQVAALVSWRMFAGISVKLRFEGLADVRGSSDYNAKLSRRRSDAVRRYVNAKVYRYITSINGSAQRYTSTSVPYGESVSRPRSSTYQQATERVVDVLMDPPITRSPEAPKPDPHKPTPEQRKRVAELLRRRFGIPGDAADAISKGGDILTLIDAVAGAPALSLVGAALGPLIAMFTLISVNAELERAPSILAMAYSVVAFAFEDKTPPEPSKKLFGSWLTFGPGSSQYERVIKAWNRFAKLTLQRLKRDELWSLEGAATYKAALRAIGHNDRQKAFKRFHSHLTKEYLGATGDSITANAAWAMNRKFTYPN